VILNPKNLDFWTKVRYRAEANKESVRICKPSVAPSVEEAPPGVPPFKHRAAYEANGKALARGLTPAAFERARLEYLEWFNERYRGKAGYFWSELADAKRKSRHWVDGVWRQGAKPPDWDKAGFSVVTLWPDLPGETLVLFRRILAKSPGRKPGRPPIFGKAMTDAERKRRQRAKEAA
jgi:hypothetical protein